MRHAPAWLAAASVASFATSAPAQRTTGSLIGPAPSQLPDGGGSDIDRARQGMYDYAECVVKRSRKRVEAYLETFPGSREASKRANSMAVDECLSSGEMRFNESLFRGGAYEILYRIDFRSKGPVNLTAATPIDYAAGATVDPYRDPGQTAALRRFADCVVRANPADAHLLTLSRASLSTEQKSFAGLMPHLEGCLPKSVTLRFSKSVLRGLVGETLYRLSASVTKSQVVRGAE